jgi:hypothetical protein
VILKVSNASPRMSLPMIIAGMPKDIDDPVSSRALMPPETSATPGTFLICWSLLRERGPMENIWPEPSAFTVTLSE